MPRFAEVVLTAAERDEFKNHLLSVDVCLDRLHAFAADGYRVGVSYSGERAAYVVSLTCRAKGDPNEGACMTSFAGDIGTAISLAVYKHEVVTEGVWPVGGRNSTESFG
jgi:hypothetical protein